MPKIVLDVDKKDIELVLNILNNLKDGLIKSIDIDKKTTTRKNNQPPKPITATPEIVSYKSNKYIDPQTFKQRLKSKRLNKNG